MTQQSRNAKSAVPVLELIKLPALFFMQFIENRGDSLERLLDENTQFVSAVEETESIVPFAI